MHFLAITATTNIRDYLGVNLFKALIKQEENLPTAFPKMFGFYASVIDFKTLFDK